jgi:hypothetical protein
MVMGANEMAKVGMWVALLDFLLIVVLFFIK